MQGDNLLKGGVFTNEVLDETKSIDSGNKQLLYSHIVSGLIVTDEMFNDKVSEKENLEFLNSLMEICDFISAAIKLIDVLLYCHSSSKKCTVGAHEFKECILLELKFKKCTNLALVFIKCSLLVIKVTDVH